MSKKTIIAIVGETGVGKDTVANLLPYPKVCSYTDRRIRADETNGKQHWFVSKTVMDELEKRKDDLIDTITNEKMSSSEFNNNSEKYIIRIREKLPDVMMLYIDKGNVYYLVRKYEINNVCYYTDMNMIYINNEIGKL